ncbi:neurotrypsin-like [Pomacea canaliculata]|uniref:neurotrypsin-like n=1 Tax=Pomacea canaliculata TaxID=400727 RepID=UPI000D72C653|nr:neurotrypsin-like [Pomacea canaliculata]
MGRLLTVFLCVVTMLLLTVWETEQVSVGPMEVRLVGGATTREGRLEVRINNDTWGTVCNNSWTTAASSVVCRQLGLGEQGQAVSVTQYGSESNLGQCSSQPWGRHNCSHNEDVGIVCYEFPAHSVRLFNDSTNWGLVEVRHRGVWGFVCEDSNWTDAAARVVCKELGFSGGGVRAPLKPACSSASNSFVISVRLFFITFNTT